MTTISIVEYSKRYKNKNITATNNNGCMTSVVTHLLTHGALLENLKRKQGKFETRVHEEYRKRFGIKNFGLGNV